MVFYIVGIQQGARSTVDTFKDAQKAIKGYGTASQLMAPGKFRASSLDVLMFINDKLGKLDGNVENILRKIQRQFLDIKEINQHKWIITTSDGDVDQIIALQRFRWNEAKFKLDLQLPKLAEVF